MNYHHFTIEERCCLREYYVKGKSYREIAKLLGRNVAKNNKGKVIDGKYKNVIWIKPKLIGTVQYMQEIENGSMRQPVWKGLKMD